MIKSEKTIKLYEPDDIYKVIEELNKGAKELGKLTLDEQMERLEKRKKDCLKSGENGKRIPLLAVTI